MSNSTPAEGTLGGAASQVEQKMAHLTTLVEQLEDHSGDSPTIAFENRLVSARLGVASSLFAALRCKHAPTAAHSLRVALGCSSWSMAIGLDEARRDVLEIAALLHDISKIGVPDRILLKPGQLAPEEVEMMNRHRAAGLDILRSCCALPEVIDAVRYASHWFDGTRPPRQPDAEPLPLASRMLAIVDAFDSMTTDQVYRRAMSRELALAELFSHAGTQFDPDLVNLFAQFQEQPPANDPVTRRWLAQLDPSLADNLWQFNPVGSGAQVQLPETLFHQKLLDNMHDAVVFVDRNSQIMLWNRGAERLTGVSSSSVYLRSFVPSLIGMQDEQGDPLVEGDCPVAYTIQTGVQSLRRLLIAGRNSRTMEVDFHAVPIVATDGTTHGAAILLHDASPEASLEKRCQSLHERATKDPLTQVANRAEFDRAHRMFLGAHLERNLPCSLIICDIDHFKLVNDVHGHQAGDEVLKSFAQVLKSSCGPGDLAARYGGEEFVMLCADCNNASAALRAEGVRRAISQLPQAVLGGRSITVSFGVTEIQPGDTPETMLRRADRALLEAKGRGRNTVVQLGSGIGEKEDKRRGGWWWFRTRSAPNILQERTLVTAVPLKVALQKLRGYVSDHHAEITSVDECEVHLTIGSERGNFLRRRTDRPVPLMVELRFVEDRHEGSNSEGRPSGRVSATKVFVTIRPKKERDRRRADAQERARHVMAGIKSYLMASEEDIIPDNTLRRATSALVPWLRKRD